jgi:hypothetical protein
MKIYFIAILSLITATTFAGEPARKTKENRISTVNEKGAVNNSFTVSNNLRRVAFRLQKENMQCAVIDGVEGPLFEEVSSPVFSADNNHFAYYGHTENKWSIITDNKEVQQITKGAVVHVRFTPDSKGIIYVLNIQNKYSIVADGKRSNEYDFIDENSIMFSADGSKMGFTAAVGNKQFNVIDGNEGTAYEQVGYPVISYNGKHFAYWGITDNKSYVILDDHESRSYDAVNEIIFNNKGNSCAYHAQRDGKHFVIIDGQESQPYQIVHSLRFSPDGAHIAYGMEILNAKTDGEEHHEEGEKEGEEEHEPFTHFAVLDGNQFGPYETVVEGGLIFSPDGKQFAFKAEKHDEFFMVLNGKEGKHYSDILQATLTFSGDNKLAFAAENDSKRMVNSDGVEGIPFNDVYSVAYGPDNSIMAYSVRKENKEFVVVNGVKGKTYDTIMGLGGIHFDSPDTFHYMTMSGNDIILVEETIAK